MTYQIKKLFLGLIAIGGIALVPLQANPLDPTKKTEISAHDHYNLIIDFFQNQEWEKLVWQVRMLIQDFPDTPILKEIYYYFGVAYYELADYELANNAFSNYLKEETTPKFFSEVIQYKFKIACSFQEGVRRNLFHLKNFPKWIHAYEEAIEIFDEIISTLPRDEMAAESLYRKASLLLLIGEYTHSVESYKTLIRRFPKHPLAPESYLGIANVYLTQCQKEFPDSERLDLAEINLQKFRLHFPSEPRLEEAEKMLSHMQEVIADDLLEVGDFYKRTKHPKAAAIYYQTIIKKYPESKAASTSKKQLKKLGIPEERTELKKSEEEAFIVQDHESS